MNNPTVKGTHELIPSHLSSAVCGGGRKRQPVAIEVYPQRTGYHARNRLRYGYPAGTSRGRKAGLWGWRAVLARLSAAEPTLNYAMDPRTLKYIAAACRGAQLVGSGRIIVERVCTDSRKVEPGDLFIALKGDTFDGHNFVADVLAKGAAAAIVARERVPAKTHGAALIVVDDTRRALGEIAAHYRHDFELPIIAIGGSNGKTSTKDLLASILKQKHQTVWSEGSFNNDIGVPMTLLKLGSVHTAAVMEVGTNHPGELAPLIKMIEPRFGIISSIGREHLEFFADLKGVAREEGILAEMLPADGKLFINGDSEMSEEIIARTRAGVVRVGFGGSNDWRPGDMRMEKERVVFHVDGPVAAYAGEYRINLLGRHQVLNAVLAIAAAVEFGVSREEIERGLEACEPAKMRLQMWEANGVRILDDAYNANADSMVAALETLQEIPCKGRRIAVLGDMAELGAHSEAAHEEVGRRAAELGVSQLFTIGENAAILARGARSAGLNRVLEFSDVETAATAVRSFIRPGDVLLLKASRAARLERVGDFLRGVPMAFVS
jgi:UDP-N-acetylmuramoyl-tripeptide--D-alanyl-D-alanine ligase